MKHSSLRIFVVLTVLAAAWALWPSDTSSPASPTSRETIKKPARAVDSPTLDRPDAQATDAAGTVEPTTLIGTVHTSIACRRVELTDASWTDNLKPLVCRRRPDALSDRYATIASAELERLAASDPHAAQMLAFRHYRAEPAQALKYVVRAVALAKNDTTPLLWYLSNVKPAPTFNDRAADELEHLKLRYVISGVAEALGAQDTWTRHPHWRDQLQRADADALTVLNPHIEHMLEEINRLQLTTGAEAPTADESL